MALKRKKGYSIESKTARFTLLRDGFDLDETKTAFNDLVSFYFAAIATHRESVKVLPTPYLLMLLNCFAVPL